MPSDRFDIVIIGSGAGGGTIAHALSASGARILVLERGEAVPREAENWSPAAVWKQQRYQTSELWLDHRDRQFQPYHALLRRRQYQVLGQRAFPAAA